MKRFLSGLVLYFAFVLPANAKMDCRLTWHLPEGTGSKEFDYTAKGELTILEHIRVAVDGDEKKSSFSIYPTYNPKWQHNAAYHIACTQQYGCTGSHVQPDENGKTEKVKRFFFDPKHPGVARIRERPILRFRPGPSNLRYDFYRNEDSSREYFWHIDLICHAH